MTREKAMELIKQQSPEVFLLKAKKRGFICPLCGNGSGTDGDGIVRNPADGRYHCFKCGLHGDIFDLIGAAFHLPDFNSCFEKASQLFGTVDELYPAVSSLKDTAEKLSSEPVGNGQETSDVSAYIERCRRNVGNTDFFSKRGLSDEIVKSFGLGYDPNFTEGTGRHVWQAAVLPTSPVTYEARNISAVPDSRGHSADKYRKHGKTVIFNLSSDYSRSCRPVFVCEGVFDALSIVQCGGQAIALGSAANYRLLLDELDKNGINFPLVLLFDSDEAGVSASKKLSEELSRRGAAFYDGSEVLAEHHDANDRLMKDPDGLAAAVAEMEERIAPVSREDRSALRDELYEVNAACCLSELIECIERKSLSPAVSTGFSSVDEALGGGIYPGLYVFGAVSSLGKTTLLLQLADNIAASGRDVLFFSLEQSRFELMSKSISRETFLFCRKNKLGMSYAMDNLSISRGLSRDMTDEIGQFVFNGAVSSYRNYADRLFLYEGKPGFTVSDIRDELRNYLSFSESGSSPVIIVDYLQILCAQGGSLTDKQAVDRNITALKQLSRDHNIPLLVISSLNRSNYSREINMEAFKESGAIEYGADVLIGLQFRGVGENGFDAAAARARSPRSIELCILKNRSGRIPAEPVGMRYFAEYNCFEEE